MKALVSPNEPVTNFDGSTGYRVAQVENQVFEVGAPLFWIDCNDSCIANDWYYNTTSNQCVPKPTPAPTETTV
jgi:hypothetical protein